MDEYTMSQSFTGQFSGQCIIFNVHILICVNVQFTRYINANKSWNITVQA